MKNSLACPKCASRRLWRIEKIETKDPSVGVGGAHPLVLAASRRTPPSKEYSLWGGDGSEHYDAGAIDAYLCAACGYMELWARDWQGLVHHPEDGVHFIDQTPQRGEYR